METKPSITKKIIICILFLIVGILAVCVILTTIIFKSAKRPYIDIHVSSLYNEPERTVCAEDNYFYLKNGSIMKIVSDGDQEIYSGNNEKSILKSFNNNLWFYNGDNKDNLIVLNTDGDQSKVYTIPDTTSDFMISKDIIYCVSRNSLDVFDIENDTLKNKEIKYSYLFSSQKYGLSLYNYQEENISCYKFSIDLNGNHFNSNFVVNQQDKSMIKCGTTRQPAWMTLSKNNLYLNYFFDTPETEKIITYSLSDWNEDEITDTDLNNAWFFENSSLYETSLNNYFVVQSSELHGVGNGMIYSGMDGMEYHGSDHLLNLDYNKNEITPIHKTRTFERILYCDAEKAITYYNGKYYTYSLSDWKVTEEHSADEIKEGKDNDNRSYSFDTCGDYIFVYDNADGELINKISIK